MQLSSKDSNQEFIMPRLFVTSLLTLFAMTSAFAEDQIVKINGAIISGQIVSEDGDAVVLSIRGIELRIPKSEIREIVRDEEEAPAPAGAPATPAPFSHLFYRKFSRRKCPLANPFLRGNDACLPAKNCPRKVGRPPALVHLKARRSSALPPPNSFPK